MKIRIQRLGYPKYYQGKSLQATDSKLKEMYATTKNDLKGADLMFYIGYETQYHGTVGLAYVGTVCGNWDYGKQSINEWRSTTVSAGWVKINIYFQTSTKKSND